MIERTSNKCYVTIYTSRPGFVIGKKEVILIKLKIIYQNLPQMKLH